MLRGPAPVEPEPSGCNWLRWRHGYHEGTAQGSLSEGSLEGEVDDGDDGEQKRTYRFRGTFENGEFVGTHAKVSTEGEPRDLGTLTLRPAD